MVREKEGKILWIDPECHLKVGFEDVDGNADVKMLPIQKLIDFVDVECNVNPEFDGVCIEIGTAHKKLHIIEKFGKCEIRKTHQKSVDNYD